MHSRGNQRDVHGLCPVRKHSLRDRRGAQGTTQKAAPSWVRAVARGRDPSEPALLNLCARGTLAMLAWMDAPSALPLSDLQLAIKVLIEGTSIGGPTGLAAPASAELIGAITAWQKAKDILYFVDRARLITKHGSADLDLERRIEDPKALLVDRTLVNPATDIIFVIELPDYDCTGQWRLKHGETHVTATCAPGTLLDRFYSRELDLRPGDALHCRVEFGTSYGPDHEVISEDFQDRRSSGDFSGGKASGGVEYRGKGRSRR